MSVDLRILGDGAAELRTVMIGGPSPTITVLIEVNLNEAGDDADITVTAGGGWSEPTAESVTEVGELLSGLGDMLSNSEAAAQFEAAYAAAIAEEEEE